MKKKTKRIIEICLLVLFIGYLVLFLIDYNRSKNSEKPLIVINVREKEYDDGTVKEYISLGWIYREYRRETITDNEIAPFWSKIKYDNELIRENEDNLPELEEYEIPSNPDKLAKFRSILYFYDEEELLGTYKCLNSEEDCSIAQNVGLEYDANPYENNSMSIIDKRYVFIDDHRSKNTPVEEPITYLLDLKANRLIAAYEGIRYTTLEEELGHIDNSKYIAKKNGLWGIDQVILGKVTNKIPFEYDYIKYDSNTKLYILKKGNEWFTLNIETNEYSVPFTKQITATYKYDDNYVIGINTTDKDTLKTNYELYNLMGEKIINKENIDYLNIFSNYIVYANNLELHIISYAGDELIAPLKLYFNNYDERWNNIKSFYIEENAEEVKITIPQKNAKERMQNEYYYSTTSWEKTKEHLNVYEAS